MIATTSTAVLLLAQHFVLPVVTSYIGNVVTQKIGDFSDRLGKSRAAGTLPANDAIARAARRAFKATLQVYAHHLRVHYGLEKTAAAASVVATAAPSEATKDWLSRLQKLLSKTDPDKEWPDFGALTANDPQQSYAGLWNDPDGVFLPELQNRTRDWIQSEAWELRKGISPPEASDWIDDGWRDPDSGQAHTLGSLWTQFFRHELTNDNAAATAQIFGILASLYEGQKEIHDQLAEVARKITSHDKALIDAIKALLPTPETLGKLLNVTADLEKNVERFEATENRFEERMDRLEAVIERLVAPRSSLEPTMTSEERWTRAVKEVAEREHLDSRELQESIDQLVAAIKSNPDATALERSLAEFAELRFEESAKIAGEAKRPAKERLLAIQKLKEGLQEKEQEALREFFQASKQEGLAFLAAKKFGQTAEVYQDALQTITKEVSQKNWSELKFLLGNAASGWATRSEGEAIKQHRQDAIQAYNDALTVYTREALPQQWAAAQNNLAVVLCDQAETGEGKEQTHLLGEAVMAYRAALTVYIREALPQDWAMTQNNLATALYSLALASEGSEQARLLGDAVTAYRNTLAVYTREALPQQWAMTQNNLAAALYSQALMCEEKERSHLLGDAVTAYRNTLTVYTREALPQQWATIQNNIAIALMRQASASTGELHARLLGDAATAYRAALTVYTREALPQDWAMTQNNLAAILDEQAMASEGKEQPRLLEEAVIAYRNALTVRTRKALPQDWAATQNNLAIALKHRAIASEGREQARLLGEAVAAYRNALTVHTREALPQQWATTQNNLAATLYFQALASKAKEERIRLLNEALVCVMAALEVRAKEYFPSQHQRSQDVLSDIQRALAEGEASDK